MRDLQLQPDHPTERLEELRERNARRRAEYERRLAEDSLTLAEAAARTGATVEMLRALVMRHGALTVDAADGPRLPPWQLREDPESPVLPDALELAAAFPADLPILHDWVLRPHPDLDGRSPAEVLMRGGAPEVSRIAAAIGAAGR